MNLKLQIALALSVLGSCTVGGGETPKKWGPITNETRIALLFNSADTTVKANQPVTLSICVENLSTNETVWLLRAMPAERDPFCSFLVLSPSGKDVSPAKPKGHSGGATSSIVLPKRTTAFDFELTKLCTFTEVGTYRIMVTREIWSVSNRPPFIARSALLPITVVPGRWKAPPRTPIHW